MKQTNKEQTLLQEVKCHSCNYARLSLVGLLNQQALILQCPHCGSLNKILLNPTIKNIKAEPLEKKQPGYLK